MKKNVFVWMFPLFIFMLLIPMNETASASANSQIHVIIDREYQYFDQEPMMINNRTLVPMRHIFEALGVTVAWDGKTNTVTATKGEKIVKLKINAKTATINNTTVSLDVPAQVRNGRTLVPLRFVTQALGSSVTWDRYANTVYIETSNDEIERIKNRLYQIEFSTLLILNQQMESELFYGTKLPFSQIEKQLENYYSSSFIKNVWEPFYHSGYFSEWYTHTTYLFSFLLNSSYLTEDAYFYVEKGGANKRVIHFFDDPRVSEGPMDVPLSDHSYELLNIGTGWVVDKIY